MSRRTSISAGLLLFRRMDGEVEYFLAHPGGPFWRRRDQGAWTIPKGILEPGEEPLEGAIREFREETGIEPEPPFIALGSVRQKSGKVVHAWAWEGDANADAIRSNEARMEYPRGSGRWITYPEIDRCGWFTHADALRLANPSQVPLLDRLQQEVRREVD